VRESRTLGSVGAKAEWLSYPTISSVPDADLVCHSNPAHCKAGHLHVEPLDGRREVYQCTCR